MERIFLLLFILFFASLGHRPALSQNSSKQKLSSNNEAQNKLSKPKATFTVTGRVATEIGGSINMAKITIQSSATIIKYTSSSGYYSFTAEEGSSYTITPDLDRYLFVPASLTINNVTANIDNANFIAKPFYRIYGYIHTENYTYLSGIKVSIAGSINKEITTLINGSYRFDSLLRGSYTVTAHSDIYQFQPQSYTFTNISTDQVQKYFLATPLPTYSLSGYVRSVTGEPLQGAQVSLAGNKTLSTNTNSSGYYTFSGLTPGIYSVSVLHNNYFFMVSSQNINISSSSVENINFEGKRFYSISGKITDESNSPLPFAKLTLSSLSNSETYTDNYGNYIFNTVFNEPMRITPYKYSYIFTPPYIELSGIASDINGINFSATKMELYSISGTITDKKGKAIKNARVVIAGRNSMETQSDNNGSFLFTDVEKGFYKIYFYLSGFKFAQTGDSLDLNQNVSNLLITAEPFYLITGVISDNKGSPLPDITVALSDSNLLKSSKTNIYGTYRFDSIVTGRYKISVIETSYAANPSTIVIENLTGNLTNQNFTAARYFRISGSVKDANNRPISNVKITAVVGSTYSSFTDSSGTFVLDSLPEGNIKITVYSEGIIFEPNEIFFSPLNHDTSGLKILGYVKISGKILSSTAKPLAGATVKLIGSINDSCLTDNTGLFIFDRLPLGRYTIIPELANYSFIPPYYHYDSLTKSKMEQNITAISGLSISGFVKSPKQRALKNILVSLSNGQTALTDSNGFYTFNDINGGNLTLKPIDSAFIFLPEMYLYEDIKSSLKNQNFLASRVFTVEGRVSDFKNNPIDSVYITNKNDSANYTISDLSGNYCLKKLTGSDIIFTTSRKGYYFSPPEIVLAEADSAIITRNINGYFVIKGSVKNALGNPVPEASLKMSGDINKTTVSNENGYFEFINLSLGSYKIEISKNGYKFSPPIRDYYPLSTSIEDEIFTGIKNNLITGRISDIKNQSINDVVLSVTGDTTLIEKVNGDYAIQGLNFGNYIITPLKAGLLFHPPEFSITQFDKDYKIDFLGCITISGRITDTLNRAKGNIEIMLTGEKSMTTQTNSEGFYLFDSLCSGKYLIMPKNTQYLFQPEMIILQEINRRIESQNFICKNSTANSVVRSSLPVKTRLLNSYPNPFNGLTRIVFSLSEKSIVTLSIYDILGREIQCLLKDESLEPGMHRKEWDSGKVPVSSGIYFFVLSIKGKEICRFSGKMLMLR